MGVDIAGCADVTVTKPLLDFLQAHAIGIEQPGTLLASTGSLAKTGAFLQLHFSREIIILIL